MKFQPYGRAFQKAKPEEDTKEIKKKGHIRLYLKCVNKNTAPATSEALEEFRGSTINVTVVRTSISRQNK